MHRVRRAILCAGLTVAAIIVATTFADAAAPPAGTTSRQAREDSIRSLPLAKLSPEDRAKAMSLISDGSVFRRMPVQVIQCEPEFYTFLVDHPEIIVNIWSVLKISEVSLVRIDDGVYQANDGAGTKGRVQYLYRSPETHLLYGEGTYEGAMFTRPLRGRCLMLLKTASTRETNGRHYVTCRLDAFMQLDNIGIEILAKTFQPLVGPVADHNFRETVGFVENLNRAAEINYVGVQELGARLEKVDPQTRREFARLSEGVAIKAALATADRTPLLREPPLDTARRPTPKPVAPRR